MSPFQLQAAQEFISRFQRVKRSPQTLDIKLREMDRLIHWHISRPLEERPRVAFMPATRALRGPPQIRRSLESPQARSLAKELSSTTEFADVLMYLDTTTQLFLKTADALASALQSSAELDWSPAIVALCKAFELELVQRILVPLRSRSSGDDLSDDLQDADLGRIAKFCGSSVVKPPELGTFGYFLKVAIHSTRRRNSSRLLRQFYELINEWPRSSWVIDPVGLPAAIERLTTDFRNRAAHIEQLAELEFTNCSKFVRDNPDKIIVRLVVATEG